MKVGDLCILQGIDFWEGGTLGKSGLGTLYRTIMLENVSVDVVDGARVKGVLGCPSVPGRTEGVNKFVCGVHHGLRSVDDKSLPLYSLY